MSFMKLNKKLFMFIIVVILVFAFFYSVNFNYASDFWNQATSWYSGGQVNTTLPGSASNIIDTLANYINIIGTAVFIIVTTVLGIKYIFGSVEDKADIKESLVTLIVAAVFFFGWAHIRNLIIGTNSNTFIFTQNATTLPQIVSKIFGIFVYVANFLAIGGIIYVGVKYLLSGASGRADLKGKSVQFVLGIIMAFATINFLNYLSKIINSIV